LGRIEAIIRSMTPQERNKPDLIDSSRRRRIAKGSGTTVQDVNALLHQFKQMQKMMQMMTGGNVKGGKGKRRMIQNMRQMMQGQQQQQ
jgi:signal recognition particle subunit SRP54